MQDTFPTALFGFGSQEVNIERQTLEGGRSLSGEEDRIATDGGGRVIADFGNGPLPDRQLNLAWRALVTLIEEGVTRIIVPFCDIRHQPYGPDVGGVPHSDDTPFSDDSLYDGSAGGGTVAADAALRATSLQIFTTLAQPLIGGEWFSILHPTKNWRAYRIAKVAPIEGGYNVIFRPPLREAVTVGEFVELLNPRCLMVAATSVSTGLDHHRVGVAAIRFVEAP